MPLDVVFDPAARPRTFSHSFPVRTVLALAGVLVLALVAGRLGAVDRSVVRVVGVAAAHGALLTIPLAGAGALWGGHAAVLIALLGSAAAVTEWSAWGAAIYLAVPLALIAIAARQPALVAIGLCPPATRGTAIVGASAGVFLGGHLLVSASRTFGYSVRVFPLDQYLVALAYDLGANVPSQECFFRGVLFNRAQRRWPFGPAAALSTSASLLRYLVDPAFPRAVETIAAATFYLTLLNVANCWLYSRSGSLLPGALLSTGFFAAYRALGGWW